MEPLPETAEALKEMVSYGDTVAATELWRIGRQVREVIPACVGVSLGLHADRFTFTLVADNMLSRDLDVVQYLDDGPCVTAMDAGDTVSTTAAALLDEDRWLMFARTQTANGVKSSLSLPILREGRVIAGVNLYASTPDAFDGHHDELAAICRAWAPGAVANADLSFSTRLEAIATPQRMYDQNDIDQAIGLLAASQHINTANAALRIQEAAARAGISETQAARAIIRALTSS